MKKSSIKSSFTMRGQYFSFMSGSIVGQSIGSREIGKQRRYKSQVAFLRKILKCIRRTVCIKIQFMLVIYDKRE
jgi:hypothetical protein